MEYTPVRVSDIIRRINHDIYLPAIQREFVWERDQVERLFDSIMTDFPIGSFLYWHLEEENKNQWPIYEFIRDFDEATPHNPQANLSGINKDITLVLDGQQRIASLFIGLRGSYRYFYYRWRQTRLYLNLLKVPTPSEDNPEGLRYGFEFRENAESSGDEPQLWYLVGDILDFDDDAEDAKTAMEEQLANLTKEQRDNANRLIGRLHSRIHTMTVGNYYKERSQDYEKVLQIFVRANSAGEPLGYSDLLLATATAQWETLDARKEIHAFTDSLNDIIGNRNKFGKDFVLKACLYLTGNLPIQYKVKNFTKTNLRLIEENWDSIKQFLSTTVRLIKKFGFTDKNIVAPLALLPIALYIMKRDNPSFNTSSTTEDVEAQVAIRKWFIFSTLKNAFGGSSDTTLSRLRDLLKTSNVTTTSFPDADLYKSLEIDPRLTDDEIDHILEYKHGERYTHLVLSLLYPDRDWRDKEFHEDHIFPKAEFSRGALKNKKYDDNRIDLYMSKYDTLANLQLLTAPENRSKNATPFGEWVRSVDVNFQTHLIPCLNNYDMDSFEKFLELRTDLIKQKLRNL